MLELVIIFALVFVAGPYCYVSLLRRAPSRRQFVGLGFITGGATALGFALRYLADGWGQDMLVTVAGIGAIWLAWIAILAFVAQTFRKHDAGANVRRWTMVIGALATTIPWFGLASARMMTF
jgi:hypothetical protein